MRLRPATPTFQRGYLGVATRRALNQGSGERPAFAYDFTLGQINPIIGGGTTTISVDADGTFVNNSGLVTQATLNTARPDYNPTTLAIRGLLVEQARTNALLRSSEFDNGTAWSLGVGAATVQANATTSPDGTSNADKLRETAVTNAFGVSQSVSGAALTAYTFSVFAKAGERDTIFMQPNDSVGGAFAMFTLTGNGIVVNSGSYSGTPFTGVVATIEPYPNGWYRCVLSFTTVAATAALSAQIYLVKSTLTSYAGTLNEGLFLYGAQIAPGSYIPTAGSAVARAADAYSLSFNPGSVGTIVAEFIPQFNVAADSFIAFFGTAADSIRVQLFGGDAYLVVVTASVTQASMLLGPVTFGAINRIAVAFAANNFAGSVNGGSVVTDVAGTVPSATTLYLGASDAGAGHLNGWLRKLYYYQVRKSDRKLPELSAR